MRRFVLVSGFAFSIVGAVFFVAIMFPWLVSRQPYAFPKQPILFSHDIHVKSLGLDCTFCHRTAAISEVAGYPDVQQCMFCHQVVTQAVADQIQLLAEEPKASTAVKQSPLSQEAPLPVPGPRMPEDQQQASLRVRVPQNGSGEPKIEELRYDWQHQQSIDWVRVYRLPDHTHFPHDAHVQAGISCEYCHGDVSKMELARKDQRPLNMNDCVSCHQRYNAPTGCETCHY